jgi:predicted ATPase
MEAFTAEHYVLEVKLRRDKISSFDEYPFSLPVVRHLQTLELHPAVTFLVGENGSGKSTLMEALAVAWGFNPEGGTKNFRFGTRASHSVLHEYLRRVKSIRRPRDGFFLRAESLFNLATEIEHLDEDPTAGPPIINSYGYQSLHEQSHGELFFAVMMHGDNHICEIDTLKGCADVAAVLIKLSCLLNRKVERCSADCSCDT